MDGSLLGDEVIVSDVDEFGLLVVGVFVYKLLVNLDENIVIDCYCYFEKVM